MSRFASALLACRVILGLTGLYSVAQSPSEIPDPTLWVQPLIQPPPFLKRKNTSPLIPTISTI